MSEQLTIPVVAEESRCPLCSRALNARWLRKKPRRTSVNEIVVCKKCRNGFASRRQGAYIIDTLVWELAAYIPLVLLGVFPGFGFLRALNLPANPDPNVVVIFFMWIFPLTFYLKDGFRGMSPGKALCGLQVLDWRTREPISFGRSLKRNICLIIPFVPIVLLVTLMKGWRWGDKWANTRVVWRKYEFKPPFDPRGLRCVSCGYNLTGNTSGRCPECGTSIDHGT